MVRIILIDRYYSDLPAHLHGAYGLTPLDFYAPVNKAWEAMPKNTQVKKDEFTQNLIDLYSRNDLLYQPLMVNPPPENTVIYGVRTIPEVKWLKEAMGARVWEVKAHDHVSFLEDAPHLLDVTIFREDYKLPIDNIKIAMRA